MGYRGVPFPTGGREGAEGFSRLAQRALDYVAGHRLTEHQKAQWTRLQQLVDRHLKDLLDMGYRARIPDAVKRRVVA